MIKKMEWLAVKYKTDDFLFVQKRSERENQNSVLIDAKFIIDTIVVKSFDAEEKAKEYCKNMNEIFKLIDDCLHTK